MAGKEVIDPRDQGAEGGEMLEEEGRSRSHQERSRWWWLKKGA